MLNTPLVKEIGLYTIHNHWDMNVSFGIPNPLDIKFSSPRNY